MAEVTIDEVLASETYTLKDGTEMVAYQVRFSGQAGSGTAQYSKKPSSDAPSPGESFDGEIVHRGDKATLKRIWKDQPQRSSGWKPRDPVEAKKIIRQHCQKAAMQYCQILAYTKQLPDGFDLDTVFQVADRLMEDVEAQS